MVYFWKEVCPRVTKIIFPCVKRANTKIQTHKYSISQSARKAQHFGKFLKKLSVSKMILCVKCRNILIQHEEVPERTNMWYIFEMRIVQRYQKFHFHVSNAQIQNKVPERLNMWYTFEKTIVQGYLLNLAQLYKV